MKGNELERHQRHLWPSTRADVKGGRWAKGRGSEDILTMEGMLFLAPGGMSTRRSGLRLFMPKFMGGGDLACMFLFMPPGETSSPGELRWFPYPFPINV